MDTNAITISPVWAGVLLSGGSIAVGVAIWIGKQIFATKVEVSAVEERIQQRNEKNSERQWAAIGELTNFFHRLDKDSVRLQAREEKR